MGGGWSGPCSHLILVLRHTGLEVLWLSHDLPFLSRQHTTAHHKQPETTLRAWWEPYMGAESQWRSCRKHIRIGDRQIQEAVMTLELLCWRWHPKLNLRVSTCLPALELELSEGVTPDTAPRHPECQRTCEPGKRTSLQHPDLLPNPTPQSKPQNPVQAKRL